MEFEWDSRKATVNRRKHGIAFEEAASVFGDPLAVTFLDPDHSVDEVRRLTFGYSKSGRLLLVSHCERGERTRIISARPVTRHERGIYEEEN
jgi:uncharacterized protein